MSSQPNPAEPRHPTEEDPRLNAYLFDLLDTGAKVAQSVARQADLQAQPTPEGETPHPIVDVAEQFERVSRAMRRTVLLIRHIAQNRTNPARQRTEARKRIIRQVEDAIGCGTESQRETRDMEGLRAEFRERLDAPDLDEDIANRPVADIILDIRRDLGLEEQFNLEIHRRRTPRDIEALNALAAAPTPPGPYSPAPHGPDLRNDAPKQEHPPKPPDPARKRHEPIGPPKQLISS